MENFNPKKYRDNLAEDLKGLRKDDPELAEKVLAEEKITTRYNESKEKHDLDKSTIQENFKEIQDRKTKKEALENFLTEEKNKIISEIILNENKSKFLSLETYNIDEFNKLLDDILKFKGELYLTTGREYEPTGEFFVKDELDLKVWNDNPEKHNGSFQERNLYPILSTTQNKGKETQEGLLEKYIQMYSVEELKQHVHKYGGDSEHYGFYYNVYLVKNKDK